jgi:hypothetical protein
MRLPSKKKTCWPRIGSRRQGFGRSCVHGRLRKHNLGHHGARLGTRGENRTNWTRWPVGTDGRQGWHLVFELNQTAPHLSLAKRPRDLLLQRFEQVLQRAALVGLDEDLDRHAGEQMNVPQAGDFLPW